MTPQRGAIPLELDKPRTLFFDLAATKLLVERYGLGFASELYTVVDATESSASLTLKSVEALRTFLFIALRAEAIRHGETLTPEQVGEFIRPWNVAAIFSAVIRALTGALDVPAVKAGNGAAAGIPAPPAATPKPSRKARPNKASTLKTRSGLRLQR